ncbi:hypothetical protein [Fusobacterium perfoetens]|uniref:hypothetical protein n=1 Tax=Fusobacterium perfoetens TaxID=852 RepID=UPI00130E6323|nr:hypothetical protein [Fusobacterium perfoetens]
MTKKERNDILYYKDITAQKKKISFIVILTIIISIFVLQLSKSQKDFIYIVPKIKNFEILSSNIGKYTLKNLDDIVENPTVKQINILNGSIFYNVPNGEYLVEGSYLGDTDEVHLTKEKDWEKVYLNLEGVSFSQMEERFLNILTLCLIGFNIYLYMNTKQKLPKKNTLNFMFFLVTLKIFFGLRIDPSNNILIFIDFFVTRLLLFMLIFYCLKNIFPKRFKKLKRVIFFILGFIYLYNLIIGLIICSPQVLVYFLNGHITFLKMLSFARKYIDLTRVLFFVFLITFMTYKNKIKKENILSWAVLWITYFLLEFSKELFPRFENLGYFIDIMEIFCVYWVLVFYTFKIYSRNVLRTMLYSIVITLSYISLFYFKSISQSAIILGVFLLLDFYAVIINKIMAVENKPIEEIYNRLCLIDNIKDFEKFLSKELKKYLPLEDVFVKILINKKEIYDYVEENPQDTNIISSDMLKDKNYNYAYKIGFNKNKEIALIFIKEGDEPLTIGERNFLLDFSYKISNIINKLRLETLYKELK